jgi:1-acyl-sn-glycerol-3-phosphate acyltransferase
MSFGKIKSQVHFLKPICYEEYKDMNTRQIADMVKNSIEEKIKELDAKQYENIK